MCSACCLTGLTESWCLGFWDLSMADVTSDSRSHFFLLLSKIFPRPALRKRNSGSYRSRATTSSEIAFLDQVRIPQSCPRRGIIEAPAGEDQSRLPVATTDFLGYQVPPCQDEAGFLSDKISDDRRCCRVETNHVQHPAVSWVCNREPV